MLSRFFSMLFVVLLGWLLGRALGARRRRPEGPRQQPGRLRSDGVMVRDRVCNTFLPRSRALTARVGNEEYFFCSERCRRAYLADASADPSPRAGSAGTAR